MAEKASPPTKQPLNQPNTQNWGTNESHNQVADDIKNLLEERINQQKLNLCLTLWNSKMISSDKSDPTYLTKMDKKILTAYKNLAQVRFVSTITPPTNPNLPSILR